MISSGRWQGKRPPALSHGCFRGGAPTNSGHGDPPLLMSQILRFWQSLQRKVAADAASALRERLRPARTLPSDFLDARAYVAIRTCTRGYPPITLSDLLVRVFDNWDNGHGLILDGGGILFSYCLLDSSRAWANSSTSQLSARASTTKSHLPARSVDFLSKINPSYWPTADMRQTIKRHFDLRSPKRRITCKAITHRTSPTTATPKTRFYKNGRHISDRCCRPVLRQVHHLMIDQHHNTPAPLGLTTNSPLYSITWLKASTWITVIASPVFHCHPANLTNFCPNCTKRKMHWRSWTVTSIYGARIHPQKKHHLPGIIPTSPMRPCTRRAISSSASLKCCE